MQNNYVFQSVAKQLNLRELFRISCILFVFELT